MRRILPALLLLALAVTLDAAPLAAQPSARAADAVQRLLADRQVTLTVTGTPYATQSSATTVVSLTRLVAGDPALARVVAGSRRLERAHDPFEATFLFADHAALEAWLARPETQTMFAGLSGRMSGMVVEVRLVTAWAAPEPE